MLQFESILRCVDHTLIAVFLGQYDGLAIRQVQFSPLRRLNHDPRQILRGFFLNFFKIYC